MTIKKKRNNKIKKRQAVEALREQQQQLHAGWMPILNGSIHPLIKKAFAYTKPHSLVFMVQHESSDGKEYPAHPIPTHVQLDIEDGEIWAKPCDPHMYPGPDQDPDIFLSLEKITLTPQQFYALHLMSTLEIWRRDVWEDQLNLNYEIVQSRRQAFATALASGEVEEAWAVVETIAEMVLQFNANEEYLDNDRRKLWRVNAFTGEKRLPADWVCKVDMTDREQYILRDRRSDAGKRKQYEEDRKIQEQWMSSSSSSSRHHSTRGSDNNAVDDAAAADASKRLMAAIDNMRAKMSQDPALQSPGGSLTPLLDGPNQQDQPPSAFPATMPNADLNDAPPPYYEEHEGPPMQRERRPLPAWLDHRRSHSEARNIIKEAMSDNMKVTRNFRSMPVLVATPVVSNVYTLIKPRAEGGKQGFCLSDCSVFAAHELEDESDMDDDDDNNNNNNSSSSSKNRPTPSKQRRNRSSYLAITDNKSITATTKAKATAKTSGHPTSSSENGLKQPGQEKNAQDRPVEEKWTSSERLYIACLGVEEVLELSERALAVFGPKFLDDSRFIIMVKTH